MGEYDSEKREALYRQVEQTVVEEAAWVPLFFGVDNWLIKPYVKDAYLPPMVIPRYQYYSVEQ